MNYARFAFFSHADTDLIMLAKAKSLLPDDFGHVTGFSLQKNSEEKMLDWIQSSLPNFDLIVLRLLSKINAVPGLKQLLTAAKQLNKPVIALSGTNEIDVDLAAISTVATDIMPDVIAYFQAGGCENLAELFKYLSDRVFLNGWGYAPPVVLPEHGIYHPDFRNNLSIAEWQKNKNADYPTIGILFYRAHWLSGNTFFLDQLIRKLENGKYNVMPVFTASLRDFTSTSNGTAAIFNYFADHGQPSINLLINTLSFAMAQTNDESEKQDVLSKLNVPVLQAIICNATENEWQLSTRGLSPLEVAMHIVLPEFDGKIISIPIAFKSDIEDKNTEAIYTTRDERLDRLVGLSQRLCNLQNKVNSNKRIAFVLTNASTKAGQIGNAVGLDTPASLIEILQALKDAGYTIGELPSDGNQLVHNLIDRGCYDQAYLTTEQCAKSMGRISGQLYERWFAQLPLTLRQQMIDKWGSPPGEAYIDKNELVFSGISFGNILIALQPPRGYGLDPQAIYHMPDLPPTHHYYAFYRWLDEVWGADAIVHMGKHGTLEWLPGKATGLSEECFPDAILADMPLFYPFIINNPGEGSQAKRRTHATIIDHLTPPMTTADTYGELAQLAELVDEYYQMETLDPSKLSLLQQEIWQLIKAANLDTDLNLILKHDHDEDDEHHDEHEDDEHEHEFDQRLNENGVPLGLAKMNAKDFDHLLQEIDAYLCDLGRVEIRDGLHIFGLPPTGDQLTDTLVSLTRLPNLNIPGLENSLAKIFGLNMNELLSNKEKAFDINTPNIAELAKLSGLQIKKRTDAIAALDTLSRQTILNWQKNIDAEQIDAEEGTSKLSALPKEISKYVQDTLIPNLWQTKNEISNLLKGLNGEYIAPGPSGSPSRGMAYILPTGRNFYSIDPRSVPSRSAWIVGQQLANEVLRRHYKEKGFYPESVALSVWGTSAMRTHGDDIAQILSLLGVRPLWLAGTNKIDGVEVIPLEELGRPRIDVTVRISGFFRDAFSNLMDLVNQAIDKVIALDEAEDMNFIRKHYLAKLQENLANGMVEQHADNKARYRIFGCKPGSYGAGILPLIQEKNWTNKQDFAQAYINWGGYAYRNEEHGVEAKEEFKQILCGVEIAIHNQDNREHDIFDSDDYLQFHGGMIATISSMTGQKPLHYFGDTSNPARAAVRDLKEEALRVFRSRVINPKWIESIKKHGYKGGLELNATVDYLFGYDATASILEDWMYEKISSTYALDKNMQQFLQANNPWALRDMTERLLESAQRKMWQEPKVETIQALQQIYLESEAMLEARSENTAMDQSAKQVSARK